MVSPARSTAYYLLLTACYLLLATYYLLLTPYYLLRTTYYLLLTTYCLLLTAYCLLPTAYCLLPTAYCLLPTAYCLLPTAYCLLLTAYCLLLTATRTRTITIPKKAMLKGNAEGASSNRHSALDKLAATNPATLSHADPNFIRTKTSASGCLRTGQVMCRNGNSRAEGVAKVDPRCWDTPPYTNNPYW